MESKDKSSRSGSKSNLNESTLPLLDDSDLMVEKGDNPKEKIEMKEKSSTSSVNEEKDDSKAETKGKEEEVTTEEPKPIKKNKSTHKRSPSCVHTMTVGLNLLDRDEKRVNEQVNIQFEDVIAEPDGTHSFDGIWRIAFVMFTGTKFWLYRLLAAIFALPCALCWGINFALISFCHIWALRPLLRILDVFFYFIKRIWSPIVHTFLDPCFESIGMCLSNIRTHHRHEQIA